MSLFPSRLRHLCLHTPIELQPAVASLGNAVLGTQAVGSSTGARSYATRPWEGRGGSRGTGGPHVAGRRKLVDLKELEPTSRGGRLEVARDGEQREFRPRGEQRGFNTRDRDSGQRNFRPRDSDSERRDFRPRDRDNEQRNFRPRDRDSERKEFRPRDRDIERKEFRPRDQRDETDRRPRGSDGTYDNVRSHPSPKSYDRPPHHDIPVPTQYGRERRTPSEPRSQLRSSYDDPAPSNPLFPRPTEPLDYAQSLSSPEFAHPDAPVSTGQRVPISTTIRDAPKSFASPEVGLLPGLIHGVEGLLGGDTLKPTPIQSLSLKWVVNYDRDEDRAFQHGEWLLAAETGSGKTLAYLTPLLQSLKAGEAAVESAPQKAERDPKLVYPRAIVLAPTHELARQISGVAKAMLHEPSVKLRVVCASRANGGLGEKKADKPVPKETPRRSVNSRDMKAAAMSDVVTFDDGSVEEVIFSTPREPSREGAPEPVEETAAVAGDAAPSTHGIDVLVGTPMKLMDMARGRWWDRLVEGGALGGSGREMDRTGDGKNTKDNRDRAITQGSPEIGLSEVEWVVVDEADVLLDPDFQEVTRTLLADISKAKGMEVKLEAFPFVSSSTGGTPSPTPATPTSPSDKKDHRKGGLATENTKASPIEYPFHLLLTSATIPQSLSRYLDIYHPRLLRLASPRLHKLPESLSVEYVKWSGGNRFVDVERRAREVWAADAVEAGSRLGGGADKDQQALPGLSKILIFCNKSAKVRELAEFLEAKGLKNVAVTGGKDEIVRSRSAEDGADTEASPQVKKGVRGRGSNKYLEAFLRPIGARKRALASAAAATDSSSSSSSAAPEKSNLKNPHMLSDPSATPHILLTTSLLSRGLDFDPSIRHVFIVDEPRNMVDFLHRAGRSGRMGGAGGRVVIFGRSGTPRVAGAFGSGGRGGGGGGGGGDWVRGVQSGKGAAYEGKGSLMGSSGPRSLGGAMLRKSAFRHGYGEKRRD